MSQGDRLVARPASRRRYRQVPSEDGFFRETPDPERASYVVTPPDLCLFAWIEGEARLYPASRAMCLFANCAIVNI
jgi:hypothetical protein